MKKFFVFVLVMFAAILTHGQGAAFTFLSNSYKPSLAHDELIFKQHVLELTEYGVTVYDSAFAVVDKYYLAGPIGPDSVLLTKYGVRYTMRIYYDDNCVTFITIIRSTDDGVKTVFGQLYNGM